MKGRTFFWVIIIAIAVLIIWGKIAKKVSYETSSCPRYSRTERREGRRNNSLLKSQLSSMSRFKGEKMRKKRMREIFLCLSGPVTVPLRKRERIIIGLDVPASFILTRENDPYRVINMGSFPVKRIFLNRRTDHRWFCYSVQNPYGYRVNLLIASPDWELPLKFGR